MRGTCPSAQSGGKGRSASVALRMVMRTMGGAADAAELLGANAYFPVSSQQVRAGA